jgi:hypothetical protein
MAVEAEQVAEVVQAAAWDPVRAAVAAAV